MSEWKFLDSEKKENKSEDLLENLVRYGKSALKSLEIIPDKKPGKTAEPANPFENSQAESLAEIRMRQEKQEKLKARLQAKHGSRLESKPLEAPDLIPENMEPEKLVPEFLTPAEAVPEGETAGMPPLQTPPPPETETLKYLTHICNQGLRGAMITNEIIDSPLALRSGYFSRYRRHIR